MTANLLQMTSASMTIYHLTDINTMIMDKNGFVLLTHEHDQLPEVVMDVQQKDLQVLNHEIERIEHSSPCSLYTNGLGFSYLTSKFEFEGEEANGVVVGPFLLQLPDMNKIDAAFRLDHTKRNIVQEFIRGLKLISNNRLQSIVNILGKASSIRQISFNILNSDQDSSERRVEDDIKIILQQPDEQYAKFIEMTYKMEKEIMHAVETGDKNKVRELVLEGHNLFDISERFPNQPLRAMKNMLIILNTLLRIAAEKGKVHPFFLHHISEKFSKQIERSDRINSLNALFEVMYDEYCDLVKERAITGYSPLVQQAAQYLMVNFSKPLNLQQLSQYCLVHPSHLSRQFKKETGDTLTDYQNRLRIDEAKLILKKERISIDLVAGQVGFEDAGYFARLFKKLEGMTPSEYRKRI